MAIGSEGSNASRPRSSWIVRGAVRAISVAPGLIPFGFIAGSAAAKAGFTPWEVAMSSVLVFAGLAQLTAYQMHGLGSTVAAIAGFVFVINSRYLLMAAAGADIARRAGATTWQRILVALTVVDETYALQASWSKKQVVPVAGLLSLGLVFLAVWVASTTAGSIVGDALPDAEKMGLDYTLAGVFLGIFAIFADSWQRLAAGMGAVALSTILTLAGLGIVGAIVVPLAGSLLLGRLTRGRD